MDFRLHPFPSAAGSTALPGGHSALTLVDVGVGFADRARKSGYNTYRGWTQTDCQDRRWITDQKEDGTLDDRRRDGGTNSTLSTKEQGTHLTLNEHDDDDDEYLFSAILLIHCLESFWRRMEHYLQRIWSNIVDIIVEKEWTYHIKSGKR